MISTALLLAGFSLFGAQQARASSAYDNTVHVTNALYYYDDDGNVIDISSTYPSILLDACGSTVHNDFLGALADGGVWAVINDNTDPMGVGIIWSKTDNAFPATVWSGSSPGTALALHSGYYGRARFYHNWSDNDQNVCTYYSL